MCNTTFVTLTKYMSSTMLLGTLLKVHTISKWLLKKQVNAIIYVAMAVSSFPPEPSYISGKIVHVISEKRVNAIT